MSNAQLPIPRPGSFAIVHGSCSQIAIFVSMHRSRAHAFARVVEKPRACQGLDIGMDIAVIATERFGQSTDAGDIVTPHVAQQLHALASENAASASQLSNARWRSWKLSPRSARCQTSMNRREASSSIAPPTVNFTSLIGSLAISSHLARNPP